MIREIYTIFLRELRKTLAEKMDLLLMIAWPIFIIFFLGFGIDSFIGADKLGVSYTNLLGPGIIALFAMSGAMSVGNSLIEDKKGFMKELLVAPISRSSIFLGKVFGEMTINFGLLFIVLVVFLFILNTLSIVSVLLSMMFLILIAFGFYGLGIVISSLFKKAKHYQLISGVIFSGIIFLSGVFFPIENLPSFLKLFSLLNPLTYGVDALRIIMIDFGEFSLIKDFVVLMVFSFVMILVGSYSFSKSLKK